MSTPNDFAEALPSIQSALVSVARAALRGRPAPAEGSPAAHCKTVVLVDGLRVVVELAAWCDGDWPQIDSSAPVGRQFTMLSEARRAAQQGKEGDR
ncbi:hypothetical protein [Streptomyces sp. NPDC052701]|uniref:hypothetical protein n=1 Tax=Streptomyces sp. NPDC052701 TaxID=3155533 RepID=UPI00343715FB